MIKDILEGKNVRGRNTASKVLHNSQLVVGWAGVTEVGWVAVLATPNMMTE